MEGNNNVTSKTADFDDIQSVTLNLEADVQLVTDSGQPVRIEGESNLLDIIILEQNGTSLRIYSEPCIHPHKSITILLPVKNLEELKLNGSGSITSKTLLKSTGLEIKINGSGDVNLNMEAADVYTKINGSGNVFLSGSAQSHDIKITGSGDLDATAFPTGKVDITVNGSGDCRVMATSKLAIKIRGSGSVYYGGSPDIDSDIKGSGSLQKI
jgi:hypothetical protein